MTPHPPGSAEAAADMTARQRAEATVSHLLSPHASGALRDHFVRVVGEAIMAAIANERYDVARLRQREDAARQREQEARAEVARLRLALEPFAKAADKWDDAPGTFTAPNVELWQRGHRIDYITVGDLRNARAAVNAATPPAPAAAREADLP